MDPRVFVPTGWGTVSPAAGWQLDAGLFTADDHVDLIGYHESNGTLWVGVNTGDGFAFQQWATVSPATGWQFTVGNFTGSNRADLLGYYPSNGTLWVGQNTGNGFSFQQWDTVSPAADWQFRAGHFTGGAAADVFGYHPGNGSLWVGQNTGSGFAFQQWGTISPAGGWQFTVGDFTGSGQPDIVGYEPATGQLRVGESSYGSFVLQPWGSVAPAAGWQLRAGYFTNRGKADLVGYHPSNGTLWVGVNTGSGFTFEQWATAAPADGWQFAPGLFDPDLWTDLIGYHPSNGSLWLWRSTVRPIEGYCWPLSAAPGERISFITSGGGQSTASFRRHTSTSAVVDSVTLGGLGFDSPTQATAPQPWSTGCGWDETFSIDVPESWGSGIYSASCTDTNGGTAEITFLVKPSPAQRSQVALLANVNTWLAYNGWGGQSKYTGLARSSFLRPMPVAAPAEDLHLTRAELWVHGWLASHGYRPDLYTDIDLHEQGCDASQYRLLVASTHPEYWTAQMRDNLDAYLAAGGSLAYLGGNGLFETCTYDATRREMVFRQGVEGGPRSPALWRVLDRHERSVLGVGTERCNVAGSPYRVVVADHPLFDGTGVVNGSTFGNSGLNTGIGNGKASAWEVDTADGPGVVSVACIEETATVPPSELPDLVVLACGIPDSGGLGADMTYYDHPGGGFVFSVGSITFGGSLVVDPVIQQIMCNVLARAGVTP